MVFSGVFNADFVDVKSDLQLRTLSVSNTVVTTETLGKLLKHCPQLEKLYADECPNLQDEILGFLGKNVPNKKIIVFIFSSS